MSYFCGKYPIIEKRSLGADVYSVTVSAPECAEAAKPGQFANITAPGFTLRRPISICGIDSERGTLRFVFEVRGKGTAAIAELRTGECLDILAPLGNGFWIPGRKEKVIVVGGGIGVPPLLYVSELKREYCTAILGFRDRSKVILTDEFKQNGSDVVICTDDGSVGVHGLVTVPLAERLSGDVSAVLACGPEPMLKAVVKLCKEKNVPCQISLEQRMGCGVGACVVCSCLTVRDGEDYYARVCKDGPVFNAEEVKFNG